MTKNEIEHKKKHGHFYTTNYDYILQNMSIPKSVKTIIEPFNSNISNGKQQNGLHLS